MRRFISHEELARDSRFRRQRSRNRLIASLPDDVDDIVRILEEVGPKIRKRLQDQRERPGYPTLNAW